MSKHDGSDLERSSVLVTMEAAIRAGHCALRVERNRRLEPFLAQARALKLAALRAKRPTDLLRMSDIQAALMMAAGVSDSDAKHLDDVAKVEAVRQFVRRIADPKMNLIDELASYFLIECDAKLDQVMRNAPNELAQRRLTRSILAHLRNGGISYRWLASSNNSWSDMSEDEAAIELNLRGISWNVEGRPRTLIYNFTVPLVGNNIDLCLFDCASEQLSKEMHKTPSAYLALGELKGGIDPVGADEHWKTARTALARIRTSFAQHKAKPKIFFIGAAVESKMATEIWTMLKKGELDNAANLTSDIQLASMTQWLCSL